MKTWLIPSTPTPREEKQGLSSSLCKPFSKGPPPAVTATVGGEAVGVIVAASPQFVGVDQANLGPLPRSLMGSGDVPVQLTVGGVQSNIVTINIQ